MLAYLQALREYVLTGSELPLQKTTNTDQAMPFLPRHLAEAAKARQPSEKTEHLERYVVPPEARFIVAAVDIQGGQDARFVVQVHAIGEHLEQWIVNRFDIRLSDREGVDGGKAPIDPASHPEDWDLLTSKVVLSTYRIADGREMRVRMVAVDTGGEDGVTQNAYSWFRRVRADGNAHRVMLVKGASSKPRTTVLETMVGAKETNVSPDVPLYLLGTDELKDAVSGALQRENPGPGYLHIPHWLPASFFDELKAEYRGANGKWVKIRRRNEAFDLCAYIRAACIRLGADRFDWASLAPAYSWAYPLEANADVIDASVRREILAAQQAGAPQQPAARRVSRSSYLR
jgi:phage terminase large subunit GpA-like protein